MLRTRRLRTSLAQHHASLQDLPRVPRSSRSGQVRLPARATVGPYGLVRVAPRPFSAERTSAGSSATRTRPSPWASTRTSSLARSTPIGRVTGWSRLSGSYSGEPPSACASVEGEATCAPHVPCAKMLRRWKKPPARHSNLLMFPATRWPSRTSLFSRAAALAVGSSRSGGRAWRRSGTRRRWCRGRASGDACAENLALVTGFAGYARSSGAPAEEGELLFATVSGAALVEDRRDPGQWQGRSAALVPHRERRGPVDPLPHRPDARALRSGCSGANRDRHEGASS